MRPFYLVIWDDDPREALIIPMNHLAVSEFERQFRQLTYALSRHPLDFEKLEVETHTYCPCGIAFKIRSAYPIVSDASIAAVDRIFSSGDPQYRLHNTQSVVAINDAGATFLPAMCQRLVEEYGLTCQGIADNTARFQFRRDLLRILCNEFAPVNADQFAQWL